MDLMHSTPSMYYDYDAHVKGELLVMMKNSQSVNLLIFISNTLIELFNDLERKLKDGGEVKEFQRSFRHSDTERLSRSDEVLKLKNFKKDAIIKEFHVINSTNGMSMSGQRSKSTVCKVSRMELMRLCLVDDL
ncbi:hypothetical protein Tco_0428469 [Tanacetum coccineum]|uniref:Uncharacterized protein n=1 Tax=Tanacetum coccineum TaxID=301880 RepID=A0ABQ4XYE9_9ASTR